MLDRLVKFFTSLKLTVLLLSLGLVLVFWGTIAQVDLGLYKAQNEFFRSFFIFWHPGNSNVKIPIFPGGYLIGGLLLINLFSAHLRYYQPGKTKWGIVMIHLGVVLLLLGQLLTDILSTESTMHLRNGETKNYSEADRRYELGIIDTSADPKQDKVVAIPGNILLKRNDVSLSDLPFTVRVKTFYANALLSEKSIPGYDEVKTTAVVGAGIWWREMPRETTMDMRDMPSGIIEPTPPQGSLGTYLVSAFLAQPQELTHDGHSYQLVLRPERFYKPFSLHLVEFKHDIYPGTDIPKNFSSRVRLQRSDSGEDREVLIYMNNPLRYAGETYYQASFDKDDAGTILQVVHNPSWLTPYFSCVLVATGLIVQFLTHLLRFAKKQRNT